MTKVVNIRDAPRGWMHDEAYVYVGRERFDLSYEDAERGFDGRFGNPYILRFEAHRDRVLSLYETWFARRMTTDATFKWRIASLWGKTLVCFCKPLRCHGDVIAEWLDAYA